MHRSILKHNLFTQYIFIDISYNVAQSVENKRQKGNFQNGEDIWPTIETKRVFQILAIYVCISQSLDNLSYSKQQLTELAFV